MENQETSTPQKEQIRRVAGDLEVTDIVPENLRDDVPVVVIPGWGETPATHTDTLNTIANLQRRAIAIKIPRLGGTRAKDGYPESEYNKALALIDTLNKKEVKTVDVIAHSEGAIPTIIAALNNPRRFRGIVFVDPAGLIGEDSLIKLSARFTGMLAKDALRMAKAPPDVKLNMLRATREAAKSFLANPKRGVQEVNTIAASDIYEMLIALREIGIKVSVIHGINDSLFPIEKVLKAAGEKGGLDTIGFYSVKGDHREISTHPEKYTALAVNALETLSNKPKFN